MQLSSLWAMKPPRPLALEVSTWGQLSLLHADGSWMCGGSLLLRVFLVTHQALWAAQALLMEGF